MFPVCWLCPVLWHLHQRGTAIYWTLFQTLLLTRPTTKKVLTFSSCLFLSIGQTTPVKSLKTVSRTISFPFLYYFPKVIYAVNFQNILNFSLFGKPLNYGSKFEYRFCLSAPPFSSHCLLSRSAFSGLLSGDCCGNKAWMFRCSGVTNTDILDKELPLLPE